MRQPFRKAAAIGLATALGVLPAQHIEDRTRDDQWHLQLLKAPEAHRQSRGDGVLVALIDTGVQADHPDLRGNILPGIDVMAGGSGNGLGDTDGHGTAMAGLIVGHGHDDNQGALGIAPNAKIVSVRMKTPSAGAGTVSEVARGVDWAIQRKARVISISNGGGASTELFEAVARARAADIVIVASAGNRAGDGIETPASYPGVIAAGAIDRAGNYDPVSATGPEMVLAAPGVDIMSTDTSGGYSKGTGTSAAAAIIAGAVALVRAKYPNLSAEEVIHRLTATAIDKGPAGRDDQYGYGVLNLIGALTADVPPFRKQTATPATSTPVPTPDTAAPSERRDRSRLWLAVLAGLLLIAVVLAAFIVARRRRNDGQQS